MTVTELLERLLAIADRDPDFLVSSEAGCLFVLSGEVAEADDADLQALGLYKAEVEDAWYFDLFEDPDKVIRKIKLPSGRTFDIEAGLLRKTRERPAETIARLTDSLKKARRELTRLRNQLR